MFGHQEVGDEPDLTLETRISFQVWPPLRLAVLGEGAVGQITSSFPTPLPMTDCVSRMAISSKSPNGWRACVACSMSG